MVDHLRISHGCNSILATETARDLADIVVTEAGFGSDLGAENSWTLKRVKQDLIWQLSLLLRQFVR